MLNLYEPPEEYQHQSSIIKGRESAYNLWVRTTLPDKISKDSHIYLYGVYGSFVVYIDGQVIYKNIPGKTQSLQTYYPYQFHLIPIKEAYAGKKITFSNYSEHFFIGIKGKILFGPKRDLIVKLIYGDWDFIFIALLFLIFTFWSLVLSFKERNPLFISMTFFFFTNIILAIDFVKGKQLVFDSPEFWSYIQLIFSPLSVIAGFIFVEQLIGGNKVIRRTWQVMAIYLAFSLVFSKINPIFESAGAFALLPIAMTILLAVIIRLTFKGDPIAKILVSGFIIVFLLVLYDLSIRIGVVPWSQPVGHWGVMIFSLFVWRATFKIRGTLEKA